MRCSPNDKGRSRALRHSPGAVALFGTLILFGALMDTKAATTQESLPAFDPLWNYGDPSGTEAKFRDVLSKTERIAPPDYVAEVLTQIARCQGLQDKFDEAHQTLDRAEKLLTPGKDRARVRYLLERGRAFNSSGHPAKALPLFEEAYKVGNAAGETRLSFDALHMVALTQPDPASKIDWNLKGIAAVAKTPSERGWLPAFYNNLGEAYAAKQEYGKALDAFRKLNEITTSKGKPADIYTQKDIARMLRKLGRAEEALTVIRPIHESLEAQSKPDGWIDEEMAECLLITGGEAKARPLFKRAYESLRTDAWVRKNDPDKLDRLKAMGGT
jgi:tetratricopeptide (TPR) repeat protein